MNNNPFMNKATEIAKQLGAKGGNTTKARHGREYYQEIGRKGAEVRHNKDQEQQCKYCDLHMYMTSFHKNYHIRLLTTNE